MKSDISRPAASAGVQEPTVNLTSRLTTLFGIPFISAGSGFSTLRVKTLCAILSVTVGLLLALIIPLYTIILNSFVQLEETTMRTDVSRGLGALDAKMDSLLGTAQNWADWDATYDYAQTHDPSYVQENLPDLAFSTLRLNVFAFYDASGRLIYGRAYDYENNAPLLLPDFFRCANATCGKLLEHHDIAGSLKGLVLLPEGPAMVVSLPILNNAKQGPSHGTLVIARFLGSSEIARLSNTTALNISVQSLSSFSASPMARSLDTTAAPASSITSVHALNEETIVGSILLHDIFDHPVLVLSVTSPRIIYTQGKNSVLFFIMALVVAGLVFCILAVALMERVVLSRLSALSERVAQIGMAGDSAARVSVSGNDELSLLGNNINSTLAALERSYHARRDTEANYRAVVEQTSEGVFLLDAQTGCFLESNAAFRELLGYTPEEVSHLVLSDVIAFDTKTLDLVLKLVVTDKRLVMDDVQYRRKDGSYVDVAINASYIRRDAGDVLCFVAHDLTERKRAEEARALHLSEERFRSLVQNAADIISIINPDGTIRYQSPSVESILGYKAEELVGKNVFHLVHPDDIAHAQTELGNLLVDADSTERARIRVKHADGTWRHLEAIGANLLHDSTVGGILLNIRDITERKALEDRLTHQAFHDPLTGLPNRMYFNNRLQIALDAANRRNTAIAVVFLDLDNFKIINDSLGHHAGDLLLIEIAYRLRAALRAGDTVARFGGDEFTFLLESDVTMQSVVQAVERIQAILQRTLSIEGHELSATSSIGIALSNNDIQRPDDLLRNADIALYKAKRTGKARYAIYQSEMKADAVDRLQTEIELRRALERNELLLYYQPMVELTTGNVVGVEALIRWRHPTRGIVGPNDFIPYAEENGMIIPIGQWALEEACRQVKAWQGDPAITPTLTANVNVSARQFQQPDLVDCVARVLQETGLSPSCLKLEITESIGMEDAEQTLVMLNQLKALGVGLALDDFGMGHSALSYLKRFPIDTLKLDRLFINGLGTNKQDTAIVQAAIRVAQVMQLAITAEGVETKEQIQALYSLGCDHGQGYYFARPMPAFAMETYLKVKRVQLQETSTRRLENIQV